jgi:hypothetical protein
MSLGKVSYDFLLQSMTTPEMWMLSVQFIYLAIIFLGEDFFYLMIDFLIIFQVQM